MDILDQIKTYLMCYSEYNMFFMFDESELPLYNAVPLLIDECIGHSYWDITLDAEVFDAILEPLDTFYDRRKRIKYAVSRLCSAIMYKLGIDTDVNIIDSHEFENCIVDLCQNAGAESLRVNLMLDGVNDIDLQIAINELMAHSGVTFFCYTTKSPLTLMTPEEEILTYTEDYFVECSSARLENCYDEIERKMLR